MSSRRSRGHRSVKPGDHPLGVFLQGADLALKGLVVLGQLVAVADTDDDMHIGSMNLTSISKAGLATMETYSVMNSKHFLLCAAVIA